MDFADLRNNQERQEIGMEYELLDPVGGTPTGMKLTIAGPDSKIQANAAYDLREKIRNIEAHMLKIYVHGKKHSRDEAIENLTIEMLSKCVVGWNITEGGEPVPFSFANVVRLIKSAKWVRAQIDEYAASREKYFPQEQS